MTKVSVIMAAYNSEQSIEEAIKSIIHQSFSDWELLICDDCSTDLTYQIACEYSYTDSRIKVIKNPKNSKAAFTRNNCLEIAQGKFIAVQDADDISKLTRLEKQITFLELNKKIDFVGTKSSSFDENGVWRTTNPINNPKARDFLKGTPFTHASIMFRRKPIKEVNGYRVADETTRGEDTDMLMRMYALGYKGANIHEVLYMYREDMNALNRRTFKTRVEIALTDVKNFRKLKLMPVGYLYAIRTIIVGLIPNWLYLKIKKELSR